MALDSYRIWQLSEAPLLTLESYLSEGIYRDREDIAAVERVLRETGETIHLSFDENSEDWPYEIRREDDRTTTRYSQSTAAMMIDAIDLLLGVTTKNQRKAPYPFDPGVIGSSLEQKRDTAFRKLVREIERTKIEAEAKCQKTADGKPVVTFSGTYGRNDPITLSFLTEILAVSIAEPPQWLWNYAREAATGLLGRDPITQCEQFFDFEQNRESGTSRPMSNAFVPLRIVRACSKLGVQHVGSSRYLSYFESTLHEQLSYSSIPDSRFDPAELIFCLEGMLRLSKQSVDIPLFERIVDVLEVAQKTSAHWRPNKPFLRSERGLVLFPISVEAANSLLWSCAALDKNERFHRYSERYIMLFRRFWGWLAARRVTVRPRQSGWHSDHVADPDSVQLWDTAQVVEFLIGYRRSLHNHIARTTLRLARFDVRHPKLKQTVWSEIVTDFEPVTSLGTYYETYKRIGTEFLDDWLNGEPIKFSMLLYGPPGTGKTTVAENLADALKFPMVTITVSDFLAEGGGGIEARAKMIFEVLEEQADCVILFDEIDELVLDRSSERHRQQDTVFKFMTPGMLTKLNNLRRAKRSIFIMATNYAYRIDPAIRRTGRIDENYLLLPPDGCTRKRMINGFLEGAKKKKQLNETDALYPEHLGTGDRAILTKASFFLGYKDMEAAVSRAVLAKLDVIALKEVMLHLGRTTTLLTYKPAFVESADDRMAVEREFMPLVKMAANEGDDAAAVHAALRIEFAASEIKASRNSDTPVYQDCNTLKLAANQFVEGQNDSEGAAQ